MRTPILIACVAAMSSSLHADPVLTDTVKADGSRYELFTYLPDDDRSWLVARDFAIDRGGHLVNITSTDENQLLVDAFHTLMLTHPEQFAWIGGTDEAQEQRWLWRDGDEAGLAFWDGPPGGGAIAGVYHNWHPSEPNNFGPDNYCGILLGQFSSLTPGVWIDSPLNPPLGSDPIGGFVVESPVCSADLAPPFDILDLADINAFVVAFLAQDAVADLATPLGVWDLDDVNLFVESFLAGCP